MCSRSLPLGPWPGDWPFPVPLECPVWAHILPAHSAGMALHCASVQQAWHDLTARSDTPVLALLQPVAPHLIAIKLLHQASYLHCSLRNAPPLTQPVAARWLVRATLATRRSAHPGEGCGDEVAGARGPLDRWHAPPENIDCLTEHPRAQERGLLQRSDTGSLMVCRDVPAGTRLLTVSSNTSPALWGLSWPNGVPPPNVSLDSQP